MMPPVPVSERYAGTLSRDRGTAVLVPDGAEPVPSCFEWTTTEAPPAYVDDDPEPGDDAEGAR